MCYSKGATKNQSSAGTEMNGQSNSAHGSPEWKQLKCLSAEEWGVMHMWEYYSVKKQWNLDTYHTVNESEDTKLSERSRGWRWGGKVMCSELFLVKHSEEVALQRHTLLICIYRAWEENGIGNGGCWKWFPLGRRWCFGTTWRRWSPSISKSLKWHWTIDFKVFGFMSSEFFLDMKKENGEDYFIRKDVIEYLVGKTEGWAKDSGPRKSLCLQVWNTERIHGSRFPKAYYS